MNQNFHIVKKINLTYNKIFKRAQCFAPYVPLGSSIIFSKNIWHGTYIKPKMKKNRYSLDFRVCGDFLEDETNIDIHGIKYIMDQSGNFHFKESENFYNYERREYFPLYKRLLKK